MCENGPARNASPSSVSRVSPSQRLPTPRHSTHQPPRQSLFLASFFTLSWLHLCEPFIYGKRFSKSQSDIVLVLRPCDTGRYQTTFTNKVYKPKLDLFALSTPFVTGQRYAFIFNTRRNPPFPLASLFLLTPTPSTMRHSQA